MQDSKALAILNLVDLILKKIYKLRGKIWKKM